MSFFISSLHDFLRLPKPRLSFTSPAEPSAREILQPLVERGIPFAIALGNHDSDFDLSRSDIFKVYRSVQGNVNTPDDLGLHGCSNDILTLSRIQAGVEIMDMQPVDLQKAAESILSTYRVLEEQEGFSIRLQTRISYSHSIATVRLYSPIRVPTG